MPEEIHYELLSCGHQNNLMKKNEDGSLNESGICPKGDTNITVVKQALKHEKPKKIQSI